MYLLPSRTVYANQTLPVTFSRRKAFKIHSMKNKDTLRHYKEQKQRISKDISEKILITIETCTTKSKLKECIVMWGEIEELSATSNDLKHKIKEKEKEN